MHATTWLHCKTECCPVVQRAGADDEESWAAAVLHRRGEQGLLQAHEMVERSLGRKLRAGWVGWWLPS